MCFYRQRTNPSRRRSAATAVCVGMALFAATASAEPGFWQPPTGPGGGAVSDLVRQPSGALYAAMYEDVIYRSGDGGYSWQPLPKIAPRLDALENGVLCDGRQLDRRATMAHLDASRCRDRRRGPSSQHQWEALSRRFGVWRPRTTGSPESDLAHRRPVYARS